ncbi:hypothetical protein IM660_06975 [Ruania alkalisoli]|uniref:Uncharacterized protein n=1 Tax=Ruania alkalisoli TaxID=2779775 RepID=A0A7M1SWV8_9MICO|nr:hypothetical protein [Ruania alkalisoli]QOR71981.1 hypothetical protein IM660_06975 [Ruania alkalisoli]
MAQRGGLGPWGVALVCVDALLIVALVIILVTWPDSSAAREDPTGDAGTATGGTAATDGAGAGGDGTDSGETTDAPQVDVPEDVLDLTGFMLPSGNIWCELGNDAATCVIESFSYSPPSIEDCAADDSGYRWEVSADGATPVCGAAPEQPGGLTELDYGQATLVGDILCESTTDGPVCRSVTTGHGFQIARGGTRTF